MMRDLTLKTGRSSALDTSLTIQTCAPLLGQVPDWSLFRGLLRSCDSCPARREAQQPALPEGPTTAELVFVGRNPDKLDNRLHRTFNPDHPSGRLVSQMIRIMGFTRDQVYLTYSLFCHTRNNRIPLSTELTTCTPWKVWEMDRLRDARFVVLMGIDSVKQFFGDRDPSIMKMFWDVYGVEFRGRTVWVFPCYHPGYIVRSHELKEPVAHWAQAVGEFIAERRKTSE